MLNVQGMMLVEEVLKASKYITSDAGVGYSIQNI